jgi:hypothetical protein
MSENEARTNGKSRNTNPKLALDPVLAPSFESGLQRVMKQKAACLQKGAVPLSVGEKNRQNIPSTACCGKSA